MRAKVTIMFYIPILVVMACGGNKQHTPSVMQPKRKPSLHVSMLDSLYYTNSFYIKVVEGYYEEMKKRDTTFEFTIDEAGVSVRRGRAMVTVDYEVELRHTQMDSDWRGGQLNPVDYLEGSEMRMTIVNFTYVKDVKETSELTEDFVSEDSNYPELEWPVELRETPTGRVVDTLRKRPVRLKVSAYAQCGETSIDGERFVKFKWKGKELWAREFYYWMMNEDLWTVDDKGDSIPPHSEQVRQRSLRPADGREKEWEWDLPSRNFISPR